MAKKKLVKRTLSKVEKFYIEKNCSNNALSEICKDLGCAENVASSYYSECLANIKKAEILLQGGNRSESTRLTYKKAYNIAVDRVFVDVGDWMIE